MRLDANVPLFFSFLLTVVAQASRSNVQQKICELSQATRALSSVRGNIAYIFDDTHDKEN